MGLSAAWPLLIGANRDEMLERPWRAPGRHWPAQPDVQGGLDELAGGTWLGVNEAGLVAAVLNRRGSLGPAAGKASRGGLPLLALRHGSMTAAATAIQALDGSTYRSFNLVLADRAGAVVLRGTGAPAIELLALPPGIHMVTAHDPDDLSSARIARHLPRFRAAAVPEPPDWREWPALLADDAGPAEAAMTVRPVEGFGTVSRALVGVRSDGELVFSHIAVQA